MIGHQMALIRREIWEHRSIYVTPLAIAIVISLLTLTGQVSVSAFGEAVDLGMVGASNIDDAHRRAVLTGAFSVVTTIFAFGAWIVMVFYSLDTLYAERKDKSILFWRSLPVTDAETVISKLLTVIIVIPITFLVAAYVTHLVMLILTSLWVIVQGGNAAHLVWRSAPLFDNWTAGLILAIAMPLWLSPFLGWFMFVSAFTKRSPLLVAFLPIFVVPMLERMLLGTTLFWNAIFVRTFQPPLTSVNFEALSEQDFLPLKSEQVSLLAQIDLGKFLGSPSLWAGLIVCGLFTFGAIYVRRYRDDS
ncbi:MAG: ABC-2 transporter permease [Woeseiaceae bacterium]|nr:ABC-2 transporter permease [Woeseiaceae bacterium]